MVKKKYSIDDILAHFPEENGDGLKLYYSLKEMNNFIDEVVFKDSRYIFTTRKGSRQFGFCTHCHSKFETDGIRHNTEEICPECGSICTVKASGYGRSKMIDERYFVYYDKSEIDSEVIVARGIYAVRDYRGDYHDVVTKMMNAALYVFKPGQAMAIRRTVGYPQWRGDDTSFWTSNWERCRKIYSEDNSGHLNNIPSYCSKNSLRKAVKGTQFQYSCWEEYTSVNDDLIEFFGLFAKWPSIEYLTKLGFANLVRNRMYGHRTYSTINWRGKNLFAVLKMTKDDLNEIKENNFIISFLTLHIFQTGRKDGSNFSITDASNLATIYGHYFDDLDKLIEYGTIKKITRYLSKQAEKDTEHFYSETDALTTWKDYISDCKELGLNLEDEKVLYPRNLYRAHQNTIKQIKIKEDKELREKFKNRYKKLQKYRFKYNGLFIRPAKNQKELIAEGKTLNHCVGTYGKRHANGDTNIFFIRKLSNPNSSYFTIEIRNDYIVQVRGKNNCNPGQDVKDFIEAFKEQKLNDKKDKNKIPA